MILATKLEGENTRELILRTALELFRRYGFEVTTMRDIACAAKVATGAAYYYFPSKEAIVSAYYDQVQGTHAEKVREGWK
jgi:AcrR family transcriptional regulator